MNDFELAEQMVIGPLTDGHASTANPLDPADVDYWGPQIPWENLTQITDARGLIPKLRPEARRTLLYLIGDYWQAGIGWVGTQVPLDAVNRSIVEQEIKRSFVPQPIIQEIVQRHVAGVVGREPAFEFVSARATQNDHVVLEALDNIRSIVKDRNAAAARAAAAPAVTDPAIPGAVPLPATPEPSVADELATDASDTLEIEEHIEAIADALGIDLRDPDELDLGLLAPEYAAVVARARAIKATIAEETAAMAEVNAAVGAWFDQRNGHEIVQKFATRLRSLGHASIRFFVPAGLLRDDSSGQPSAAVGDWREALDLIYLEVPAPESAVVAMDRDTMRAVSVFAYKFLDTSGAVPVTRDRVEVSYVDSDGQTVIRILDDDGVVVNGEVTQDTGGELYVDMAKLPPLITEPVQRMQNALNVLNTMILHNGNLAGFRERNFINLQPPMIEVPAPTLDDPKATKKVRDSFHVGPGTANFLTGIAYESTSGDTRVAHGSISVGEPVSPEPLIVGAERFEENIYKATSQLFVKMAQDATASAVSRIQARADFLQSLLETKTKVEGVLRSRLRGVLILAAYLANDQVALRQFKELRVNAECHIDAGPLAPDERTALLNEFKSGIRSLETTQLMLGIEDVAAELQQLEDERTRSLAYRKELADITYALTLAGAGIEGAATVAGFNDDDASDLSRGDFVGPEPDAQPPGAGKSAMPKPVGSGPSGTRQDGAAAAQLGGADAGGTP